MTKPKHLPECFNGRQRSHGLPCICDRLRASEQRVREEWYAAQSEAWEQGFHYALDAAREAVAALYAELEANRADDLVDGVGEALDALDALRGGVT